MVIKMICENCEHEGRVMFKVKMAGGGAPYIINMCDRCVASWMDEIPERFISIEKISVFLQPFPVWV